MTTEDFVSGLQTLIMPARQASPRQRLRQAEDARSNLTSCFADVLRLVEDDTAALLASS